MPLETTVLDASTGKPIPKVKFVRVVCDIHNFGCRGAKIDSGEGTEDGRIDLSGHRRWGVWLPVPGGLPVPNHQIAIWADGYKVVVFSQYDDDIDKFKVRQENENIAKILETVPKENRVLINSETANQVFKDGILKLERVK